MNPSEEFNEEVEKEKIRRSVRQKKSFYSSLVSYFFVNVLLAVINFLTDPDHLWFYWVSAVWGVVLIFQAFNIFLFNSHLFGDEWEKRKVNELLEKKKKKYKP